MSDAKQNIKDAFDKIQDLSGQKGKYRALDNNVDELIDQLNEFVESADNDVEKEKAQQAIKSLLESKDDDILKVKLAEDESRGKGATKSKEREYTRQLDSAIYKIKSDISFFL